MVRRLRSIRASSMRTMVELSPPSGGTRRTVGSTGVGCAGSRVGGGCGRVQARVGVGGAYALCAHAKGGDGFRPVAGIRPRRDSLGSARPGSEMAAVTRGPFPPIGAFVTCTRI